MKYIILFIILSTIYSCSSQKSSDCTDCDIKKISELQGNVVLIASVNNDDKTEGVIGTYIVLKDSTGKMIEIKNISFSAAIANTYKIGDTIINN